MSAKGGLTNGQIVALLSREAEEASGVMEKALHRAARSAFLWPQEAASLIEEGAPLTELHGVGPHLAKLIKGWFKKPPPLGQVPMMQREFLTLAEARKILKRKPAWRKGVQGDLQMHTVWSDGSGTVEEMARAAIDRGYAYIAITDHTKWLQIAGGLDEVRLAQQGREIKKVNAKLEAEGHRFTVLRSAEVNLSPTGDVDVTPKSLAALDIVLGSFHSALRRSEDQTFRYVSALRNPSIQILGHPQCRVYNYRLGLTADWPRVFAEAAKLDKAVEIDGYADRQDLRVSLLKIARQEGARVSLGTDAHHPWQLAFMELSLAAAVLAKIPQERVINFMPAKELLAWVKRVRS